LDLDIQTEDADFCNAEVRIVDQNTKTLERTVKTNAEGATFIPTATSHSQGDTKRSGRTRLD